MATHNLTKDHFHALARMKERAEKAAARLREKFEGKTVRAVRTTEVCAGALIGGIIEGRAGAGGAHVLHVPVNLGAGLALNLLGYFDVAGDHSEHLNNFGDGFLAAEVSNIGHGIGAAWKQSGHLFGGKKGGELPSHSSGVSPGQMDEIVQRVRASAGMAG